MDDETLRTKNHQTIRSWAEERGAVPAAVPGTEHDGRLGVLRFDFLESVGQSLKHVPWDKFLKAFDERELTFVYRKTQKGARRSHYFRFDNPHRD